MISNGMPAQVPISGPVLVPLSLLRFRKINSHLKSTLIYILKNMNVCVSQKSAFLFWPSQFFGFFLNYLFLAALSLHCCPGFSLVVKSRDYSLILVHRVTLVW